MDPFVGSGSSNCTLTDPCTLDRAPATSVANGDIFLIRVRREGGTVTLAAPTAALSKRIRFGAYVKGNEDPVEGTVKFTGDFKVGGGGRFEFHEKVTVEFEDFTAGATYSIGWDNIAALERMSMTGTLKVTATWAVIDRMVVSKSFEIEAYTDKAFVVNKGLTVKEGATLTISNGTLSVVIDRERESTGTTGRITVDGTIEAKGDHTEGYIRFVRAFADRTANHFLLSSEYKPSDGVDHEDCFRIRGRGEINAELRVHGAGNICVEVKKVGRVLVSGSIKDDPVAQEAGRYDVTTDLIFREEVVVDGNVEQWNDSRVVFEKPATIRGSVILDDGPLPGPFAPATYGDARDPASQTRKGVYIRSLNKFTCQYYTERPDNQERGTHISGVQFEAKVIIEGDLEVRSDKIPEVTSRAPVGRTNNTMCAPRVLFMVPLAKSPGPPVIDTISEIGGDLVIEDDEDFNKQGRVSFGSHYIRRGLHWTFHSVRIGGDLIASGRTIGMEWYARNVNDGKCGKDSKGVELADGYYFGNRIILSDKADHVIVGALELDALFIHKSLKVENGPLTVRHLSVGPLRSGGELQADGNVVVRHALSLGGDGLRGRLSDASTIKHLVYGSRETDLVHPAALADQLEALSILLEEGELRLDEVIRTKNLGLCRGTLVLRDAGTEADSTLVVDDQILVRDGFIETDGDGGSIATDADRYLLKYITPGKREVTEALEWFDPRDVEVDHKDAEIIVKGDARSLMGKLTVTSGKLIVDGDLTVGASPNHRAGNVAANAVALTNVGKYSMVLGSAKTSGELHTEEDDVVVHGQVTLHGASKLMTGGGDVHILGRVKGGHYPDSTAQLTVSEKSMVDLGEGTLMLGPEDTAKRNGLTNTSRPDVVLTLKGSLAGNISVPKGSKVTKIDAATGSKMLGPIIFDGMKTPGASGTGNDAGLLKLMGVDDTDKKLVIDSLSALHGLVELRGKKVELTGDVHLSSAGLHLYNDSTAFKGDLKVSGTGGLSTTVNSNTAKRSVLIDGSFMQTKGTETDDSGVRLHPGTTKIVAGDFMVSDSTAAYETKKATTLILKGDVHYMKEMLHAKVEFKGEEAQEVKTGMKTELDSVVVDNPKGLRLASSVMQKEDATLTLRRGRIMNADTTAMAEVHTWTMKNPQIEENLKSRTSALEAKKCGADEDEACKFSISRGSLQSHASVSFARHLEHGNSGDGVASGGYLFPVGNTEGKQMYYRPLMLQLPFDLSEAEAATVSVMTDSEERLGAPLTVPGTSGQSLTLDVHSDMFWKIEMDETLESEVNIRIVAAGIENVSDVSGLRIVQWDCEWENPKLAGRHSATSAAGSFGVNDLLNGVVNLTQERITLETCTILGVAANGVENPINLEDLSGGRARLQFIHNLPLSAPVDVRLGDLRISSSLQFRDATAYRTFGAGSDYVLTIQPDGAPAEQSIKVPLPTLKNNRNYVAIAHGSVADPKTLFMETRLTSSVTNKVEAILVHGSADLGAVDVRVLDDSDNLTPRMVLADNIPFDGKTIYRTLDASMHNVQVSSPTNEEEYEVFRMDLGGYRNETVVLNLSGSKSDLRILGVDRNGTTFLPDVITGVETERAELPTEFTLHGNYPNPFNPSTRIRFDLPETAQVQVQIVDMLGREVMSLPTQEFEAGANRSMEIHAMNLASGTYLYRMIATGAESRHVKTGRMTLVK